MKTIFKNTTMYFGETLRGKIRRLRHPFFSVFLFRKKKKKTYPSVTGAQFLDRHLVMPARAISFTSASEKKKKGRELVSFTK